MQLTLTMCIATWNKIIQKSKVNMQFSPTNRHTCTQCVTSTLTMKDTTHNTDSSIHIQQATAQRPCNCCTVSIEQKCKSTFCSLGLSSTTVMQSASNTIKFSEITKNKGYYAIWGHYQSKAHFVLFWSYHRLLFNLWMKNGHFVF